MGYLAKQIEADATPVLKALERMREILLNRRAMLLNVTTDGARRPQFEGELAQLVGALPSSAPSAASWPKPERGLDEGLTIPALVNYVAKGANLHQLGFRPNGTAQVIRGYLGATWLWEKVRVQGGAYGGQCAFDRLSGSFTFASYRDPNLLETIDVYDRTAAYLKEAEISPAEIKRTIVGTIGELDGHQLPDAKGVSSMLRYLIGDTDDVRQRMREEILATSAKDFRDFADALAEVSKTGRVVVLGSEKAIEAANAERKGWLTVSKIL